MDEISNQQVSALVFIESLGGYPIAGHGMIMSDCFLFRLKDRRWEFAVTSGNDDPAHVIRSHKKGFYRSGAFSSQVVNIEHIRDIIISLAEEYCGSKQKANYDGTA